MSCEHARYVCTHPSFPSFPHTPSSFFLSSPPSLAPLLPCIPSFLPFSPPSHLPPWLPSFLLLLHPLLPSFVPFPPSRVPLLPSILSPLSAVCMLSCMQACVCCGCWYVLVCLVMSGQGQSDLPVVPGGNSRELLANMTAHTYSHACSFTSSLFLHR